MLVYPGSSPMATVLSPITANVISRVDLRPCRSPRLPKNIAPSGRARKPTANVPNAASVPTNPPASGKNSLGKTTAAAVP